MNMRLLSVSLCALSIILTGEQCLAANESTNDEQQQIAPDPRTFVSWDGDEASLGQDGPPSALLNTSSRHSNNIPEELKRRQVNDVSARAVDPLEAAHFNDDQLKTFVWYDRTHYPAFSKKLPPDVLCELFRDALKDWINDFQYPDVPERQMFVRVLDYIMVAHWSNSGRKGPHKWPENRREHAGDVPVIHDVGIERATRYEKMFDWINRRLGICLPEWQAGLLLLPPLAIVLGYEIAYAPYQSRDPEANSPENMGNWIEMQGMPKVAPANQQPQSPRMDDQYPPHHPDTPESSRQALARGHQEQLREQQMAEAQKLKTPRPRPKLRCPPMNDPRYIFQGHGIGKPPGQKVIGLTHAGYRIYGEVDPRKTDLKHVLKSYSGQDKELQDVLEVYLGEEEALQLLHEIGFGAEETDPQYAPHRRPPRRPEQNEHGDEDVDKSTDKNDDDNANNSNADDGSDVDSDGHSDDHPPSEYYLAPELRTIPGISQEAEAIVITLTCLAFLVFTIIVVSHALS
ncbi:MAG: hypothetical protein M1831_002169 [Alyxoria varia]|nr:MAG: hypothetical protein M1831_002169 [Alyxoria varia]